MSGFMGFMEKKVMPVAAKIGGQKHLQAVRDGIILTMPLLLVGSFFLVVGFLPIPGFSDFMANTFGDQWLTKLLYPVNATFDIMAIIVSFGVAYRLAEKYKVDPLAAGAVSVAAFFLATPYKILFTPEGSSSAYEVGGIPTVLMGSQGLFVAMILALISTEIFRKIVQKNLVIRMPAGVPPAVSRSFMALVPAFAVLLVIWIIRLLMELTSFESLHNVVKDLLQTPLEALGGTLIGALVAVLLVQLLWSVGLHGAAIVGGVLGPIWLSLMDQNRVAFTAGKELPNVVTSQFFDLWIYIGGSGATLSLVFMMLFMAKSAQLKGIGRLAIGPGIFNINEPVTFGMPIVLNPLLIIPFILAPVVITIITYLAMQFGIAPRPNGAAIPWTMPVLISGWLGTGGKFMGLLLQLVNFVVTALIYYPFFRMWDKQKLAEETAAAK